MQSQMLTLTYVLRRTTEMGMFLFALVLSWQDIRSRQVTGKALFTFTLFSLFNALLTPVKYWLQFTAGAAVAGLSMLVAARLSFCMSDREMIGNGDVWFAFATALTSGGISNALEMLASAFLLALLPAIFVVIRFIYQSFNKKDKLGENPDPCQGSLRDIIRYEIPFIPFLAISLLIIRTKTGRSF